MTSESDFKSKCAKLLPQLDVKNDWDSRIKVHISPLLTLPAHVQWTLLLVTPRLHGTLTRHWSPVRWHSSSHPHSPFVPPLALQAMLQLEGMVLGGAAQLNNFLDELRNLKDAVTEQLNDRRSAVSRVACHLLAELAISLGNKFEPLAVHFLPFMMKVSVISVQVMADAANEAMATVVQHCRAKGAVVQILSAVISERNKVMRTNCSKLLLLMLEVV